MKIGKIVGSPQEIKDFFENNGLNLKKYLEKSKKPISNTWLVLPGAIVITAMFLLIILNSVGVNLKTLIFLIGSCGVCWLSACVQIRFNSILATTFVVVGLILILLIAFGNLAPGDLPKILNELMGKG